MPTKVPDKLKGKKRLSFVRKCLMAPRKTDGKILYRASTPKEAKADPTVKNIPGKQNKHHGRKPGSYKHKRDIIRRSRRRNRAN